MNEYVKSKWVYGIIGLTVLAMIVWIIAGTGESQNENNVMVNQGTNTQETYTMEASVQENSSQSSETENGWYLVKSDGESVRVYWVDGTGEHLHRETTIAYPLLSLEDQEMLDEGIRLDTNEELASFLENFDS